MKLHFSILFFVFIIGTCKSPAPIEINSNATENTLEYIWSLKAVSCKKGMTKFRLIAYGDQRSGLLQTLDFITEEQKISYLKYLEQNNDTVYCFWETPDTSDFKVNTYYTAKVHRDNNSVSFSKIVPLELSVYYKNYEITDTVSALSKEGKVLYGIITVNLNYTGKEFELIELISQNQGEFNKKLIPDIRTEYRNFVGRYDLEEIEENISNLQERIQTNLQNLFVSEPIEIINVHVSELKKP